MEKEVLIKAEGVSKKFCRNLKKSLIYGGGDIVKGFFGIEKRQELRSDEFLAVNDVNFEVRRGECLGLIGHNGAGKSTLLKMLNGLIRPDKGRIEMHGKVGALIELGAGFSPLLTGRENVYNNGAVLGFTKDQIDEKFDDIVEFAELSDFIDTPVQNYSSGMKVRLGFAIASQIEPDILLLDEVLAVGDTAFRYKCYKKIDELREKAALIFVSHDMPSIARICNKSAVMSKGSVLYLGDTNTSIRHYYDLLETNKITSDGRLELIRKIKEFKVFNLPETIIYTSPLNFNINLSADTSIHNVTLRINIFNISDTYVASCVIDKELYDISLKEGVSQLNVTLSSVPLKRGKYYFSFGITDNNGILLMLSHKQYFINVVGGHEGVVADCQLHVTELIINNYK